MLTTCQAQNKGFSIIVSLNHCSHMKSAGFLPHWTNHKMRAEGREGNCTDVTKQVYYLDQCSLLKKKREEEEGLKALWCILKTCFIFSHDFVSWLAVSPSSYDHHWSWMSEDFSSWKGQLLHLLKMCPGYCSAGQLEPLTREPHSSVRTLHTAWAAHCRASGSHVAESKRSWTSRIMG